MPWQTVASLLVAAVLWEILGRVLDLRFLPPLSEVTDAWFALLHDGWFSVLKVSGQSFALGFGLAFVVALVVGILTTVSKTLDYVLRPYIDGFMSVPITAITPILMLIFGLGMATRVSVIFLYTFFVIVVNIQSGLRSVDPNHLEMARAFGLNSAQTLTKVTLPTAVPLVMTGVRLGVTRAIKGMVNSEVIISTAGIGWLLLRSSTEFDIASVFAITFTIVVLAVTMTSLVNLLERWVASWKS